ncbi:MAG: hypothetical protein VX288_01535 [Planctomycetota bacterium]|nr:hypothetical protein [Planctomycetota bacterium]
MADSTQPRYGSGHLVEEAARGDAGFPRAKLHKGFLEKIFDGENAPGELGSSPHQLQLPVFVDDRAVALGESRGGNQAGAGGDAGVVLQ